MMYYRLLDFGRYPVGVAPFGDYSGHADFLDRATAKSALWSDNVEVYGAEITLAIPSVIGQFNADYTHVICYAHNPSGAAYPFGTVYRITSWRAFDESIHTWVITASLDAVYTHVCANMSLPSFWHYSELYTTRDSVPDTATSYTKEPVLDDLHVKRAASYHSTHAGPFRLCVTMSVDPVSGVPININEVPASVKDLVSPPYALAFWTDLTIDNCMGVLDNMVRDLTTSGALSRLLRVQIIPASHLTLGNVDIALQFAPGEVYHFRAVLPPSTRKQLVTSFSPSTGDVAKAAYYNGSYNVAVNGNNLLQIDKTNAVDGLNVYTGYSVLNGVNPYLFVPLDDEADSTYTGQRVDYMYPEVISIGDAYTAWYEANKQSISQSNISSVVSGVLGVAQVIAGVYTGGATIGSGLATLAMTGINANAHAVQQSQAMNNARRSGSLSSGGTAAGLSDGISPSYQVVDYAITDQTEAKTRLRRYGYAHTHLYRDEIPTTASGRSRYYYVEGDLRSYRWATDTYNQADLTCTITDLETAMQEAIARGVLWWRSTDPMHEPGDVANYPNA